MKTKYSIHQVAVLPWRWCWR